jgi:hypothetical protein
MSHRYPPRPPYPPPPQGYAPYGGAPMSPPPSGWDRLMGAFGLRPHAQHARDPRALLGGRFNPLGLSVGAHIELTALRPGGYVVSGVTCFEPLGPGERATRYELASVRPPLAVEVLDGPHGLSFTLYELAEESDLDPELLRVCQHEDSIDHSYDERGVGYERTTTYLKDAEGRSRALLLDAQGASEGEVRGFYYSAEGDRFLTVELWEAARWMRFYVGRDLPGGCVRVTRR